MTRRICDVMHDNEEVMHDNEEVVILPPSATVHAAAVALAARHQCAVLVMTAERLQGIFTEQDIVRRVVAEWRDPDKVTLAEVMTPHPDTISPADNALRGLQMMEDGCYRHLPVTDLGRLVGLISRTDFLGEEKTELESERNYWEKI